MVRVHYVNALRRHSALDLQYSRAVSRHTRNYACAHTSNSDVLATCSTLRRLLLATTRSTTHQHAQQPHNMGSDWSVPADASDALWGKTVVLVVVDDSSSSSDEDLIVVTAGSCKRVDSRGDPDEGIFDLGCKMVAPVTTMKEFRVPVRYLWEASPVLKACLTNETSEAATGRIELMRGASVEDVETFLVWTSRAFVRNKLGQGHVVEYQGMNHTTLQRILPLAEYYQVNVLLQYLQNWVQTHATIKAVNAIEALFQGSFEVTWSAQAIQRLVLELIDERSLKRAALYSLQALRSSTVVAVLTIFSAQSVPRAAVEATVAAHNKAKHAAAERLMNCDEAFVSALPDRKHHYGLVGKFFKHNEYYRDGYRFEEGPDMKVPDQWSLD